MSARIGEPAPDFELRDQNLRRTRLRELRGRAVLLVFYPFAFTNVCAGELRELRDHLRHGPASVLGVSCDPPGALRAFADAEELGYPLLSDFWPHGAVAREYGVFDEARGAAERGSFLVAPDGVLRWTIRTGPTEPRPLGAYREALREVLGDAVLAG